MKADACSPAPDTERVLEALRAHRGERVRLRKLADELELPTQRVVNAVMELARLRRVLPRHAHLLVPSDRITPFSLVELADGEGGGKSSGVEPPKPRAQSFFSAPPSEQLKVGPKHDA